MTGINCREKYLARNISVSLPVGFAERCFQEAGQFAKKRGRPAEPFTHLEYADECRIKQKAFDSFCQSSGIVKPQNLVPAPCGRNYRTTSKRRVKTINERIRLICDTDEPELVSRLEPYTHAAIFTALEQLFSGLKQTLLSGINFCIVRGDTECSLIFNLAKVDRHSIHLFTKISEELKAELPALVSAFIFHDPSRSKYYLDAEALDAHAFKRLFGPRNMRVRAGGLLFQHHPLSFSQVNTAVAELIAEKISSFFEDSGDALIDLYCGYGFFSCLCAKGYQTITGIDCARESIASAKENADHLCKKSRNTFYQRSIDAKTIDTVLSPLRGAKSMILDPPRNGCGRGVIAAASALLPHKVAQLFCGAEELARECDLWTKGEYRIAELIPYDMFAGTANIETLVLMEPKRKK